MMTRYTLYLPALLLPLLFSSCVAPSDTSDDDDSAPAEGSTRLEVGTSMGSFEVELFTEESPLTTSNFLTYVDEGFYDGDDGLGATVFHRVIADFMIQGGGHTADGSSKETHAEIANEAESSGLSNTRGTLAMARTNNPDSATSQFFVNVTNNDFLDPGNSTTAGYAVFGEVISGIDIVDDIVEVATDAGDAPLQDIVIENLERL